MNQMGRSQIGYRNDEVPWYYAWNPGGCGCSGGCDGCWARALSKRLGPHCEECEAFEVHLHEERLNLPACTSPPGVVLVNFTCDTFDEERPAYEIVDMMVAARQAPHHEYVWLTKQVKSERYGSIQKHFELIDSGCFFGDDPNWHLGLSICNQAQADGKLPEFVKVKGKKWLSLEPLWERVDFNTCGAWNPNVHKMYLEGIDGVIIGHDNRKGAPGTDTLNHIEYAVQQCLASGTAVFIKQLWINGKLEKEPENFPEDLRPRDLPWSMPGERT